MNEESVYQRLRETSWERPLTAAEETRLSEWLETHPEDRADWELEQSLNGALDRLPDAPVSSNFTSRLIQSIELEERRSERETKVGSWWRLGNPWRWVLRGGLASVVLAAGLLTVHQVQVQQRQQIVDGVAAVTTVSAMPNPEILQDFEAIRALSPAPAADEELLALLQ
jgi:anti-sigma factor RsiW